MKILNKNIDLGLLILRLAIGVLLLIHGIGKVQYGIEPIIKMVEGEGLPSFFAYGVYVGELIAPMFLIVGFGTRIAGAILSFNFLVAALLAHSLDFFTLSSTGGWALELLGLYLFGSIVLMITGGGKYAISNKYIWD